MILGLEVPDVFGAGGVFARSDAAYEYRPVQERFSQAIAYGAALPGGAIVLAELPTGSGKSRGALVGPLLQGCSVWYVTANRGLQTQLRDVEFPYLARHLGPVLEREPRAVVIKGRSAYLCQRQLAEVEGPDGPAFRTPEAHDEWRVLRPWARETTEGDLDAAPVAPGPELRERLTVDDEGCDLGACPFFHSCFVTRARKAAADPGVVVVTNYHLALHDLLLRRRTGGKASVLGGSRPQVLIGDEVHALQGVARDVLGAELGFAYGVRLARRLHRLAAESGAGPDAELEALALQDALDAWATALSPRVRGAERRTGRAEVLLDDERALGLPVVDAAEAVAAACRAAAQGVERGVARALLDEADDDQQAGLTTGPLAHVARWRRQGDAAGRFAGVARLLAVPPEASAPDGDGDAFLRQAKLEGEGRRRRLVGTWTPVDVSKALGTLLWDGTAAPVVVGCSATLATAAGGPDPLGYFKQEVGVPPSTPERPVLQLVEPSAFDWAGRARLYVSPPAAIRADRQRDREAFDAQLAAEAARVLLATGGRALVLCTSTASAYALAESVGPRLPGHWKVFRQGATPRPTILAAFDAPGRPPVVAFCTRGYWEGVDIRGLDAVVVDRLPFEPPDDALHAARRRQLERATGDRWAGWERVTFPEMVLHLRQGVGRLLRVRDDRGIVALLDARVTTKGYGRAVLAALPDMPQVRSIEEVAGFFRTRPP